jgi:hypothetical protein
VRVVRLRLLNQCVADELKVPETWQGLIGGRMKAQRGMENVTADDFWPSRRAIENLVTWLAEETVKNRTG